MNPKYYDKMSELLDDLIKQRQRGSARLQGVPGEADRARRSRSAPVSPDTVPRLGRQRAPSVRSSTSACPRTSAVAVDRTVMQTKLDRWVGNPMKERRVKRAIRQAVRERATSGSTSCSNLIKARDEYR